MKILFLSIFLVCVSCKTPTNEKPSPKGNIRFVYEIINNSDNLYNYLNDTSISYKFLIVNLQRESNELQEHIIDNRFQDGYIIEYINTVRHIIQLNSDISFLKQKIKIRSTYNNEIIWFGFTYDKNVKKWKIREFWYCNNPIEMIHYGEPCDKK